MTEFTPSSFRARAILAIPGFANCLGACLLIFLGINLLQESLVGWQWRALLMAGILPDVAGICLVMLYIPESPRYLLVQNKMDEVRDVMAWIARVNGSPEKLGQSLVRLHPS